MGNPVKQHLIDPEICIRCHSCEAACEVGAISHNDDNVVVDGTKCEYCLACIPVCPTGSIDEWRMVDKFYGVDEQLGWEELPEQGGLSGPGKETDSGLEPGDEVGYSAEPTDGAITALLAEAHKGAGGEGKSSRFGFKAKHKFVQYELAR